MRAPAAATLQRLLRARRRAIVLILVLWIAVVLALLAYSALFQSTLENRIVSLRRDQFLAETLASAGIARAYTDLRNDIIFDYSQEEDPPFDAEGDVWARVDIDKQDVELGAGTFTVEVTDTDRLLNINRMGINNKPLLQAIIERVGYSEEDAEIAASAIIDYMDADDQPSLPSSVAGEESLVWGIIRAQDENLPDRPEDVELLHFPNEPLPTVDALLDVYGVTPELFFGPGTPEAEHFRELLGPRRGEMFEIQEGRRRRRSDQPLGLRDYFTVWGAQQVNINTAPAHVLEALFEAGGISDPEDLADTLIRLRRGGRSDRIDNDRAFKSLAQVQEDAQIAAGVAAISGLYPVNVQSFHFRVRSTGRVGESTATKEVVVLRGLSLMQVQEDYERTPVEEERAERLEERTERRIDRDNALVVRIPTIRTIQWIDP